MHLMIDLETLGVQPDAVVLRVAAFAFDPEATHAPQFDAERADGRVREMDEQCDWVEQVRRGRRVESGAQDFWLTQVPELRDRMLSLGQETRLVLQALSDLYADTGSSAVWSRGSMDVAQLVHMYKLYGLECPWRYHQERDVRTLAKVVAASAQLSDADSFNAPKHDPRWDCYVQAFNVWEAFQHIRRPT